MILLDKNLFQNEKRGKKKKKKEKKEEERGGGGGGGGGGSFLSSHIVVSQTGKKVWRSMEVFIKNNFLKIKGKQQ